MRGVYNSNSSSSNRHLSSTLAAAVAVAETVSWYSALFLAVMLLLSCCENSNYNDDELEAVLMQNRDLERPATTAAAVCDEIYVVKEGETLHTISEKCGDPYIVEENPHIHDPDDVFPGLVIKITPFNPT